jgi:hypothetical protein
MKSNVIKMLYCVFSCCTASSQNKMRLKKYYILENSPGSNTISGIWKMFFFHSLLLIYKLIIS